MLSYIDTITHIYQSFHFFDEQDANKMKRLQCYRKMIAITKLLILLVFLYICMIMSTMRNNQQMYLKNYASSTLTTVEQSQIAAITSRAHVVWKETRHTGLEITSPSSPLNNIMEGKHFTFTPYNQPVGTSTYFDIRLENAANSSHVITGRIGNDMDAKALENTLLMNENCMQRVVCESLEME